MCKYLVGTSISREINAIIKVVKKESPDFDSQREMLCMRLEEYYKTDKAGGGKKDSKELIYRLYEISENRGIKSFWLSILIGEVIGVLVSVSKVFIDDNEAIWVAIIALTAVLALVAIVGWYFYSHLSPYDRFYLQKQEKEFIEKVLEDRQNNLQDKQAETVDCAAHPTTKP